jgi:endonuclease/exonuclease/phosphatase family metal-dependent hydrolase
MRLATYNVENLFDRAKVMSLETWEEGRGVLTAFARLSQMLGDTHYSSAAKTRMMKLMQDLGLAASDQGPFVRLRRNRGRLLKRPKDGDLEIIANGRADWAGSLELIEVPINDLAMRNTAQVMMDLEADVLAIVEAESRPVLDRFNRDIISAMGGMPFRHVMAIDGNDDRGIDVGLMTGADYPIDWLRSHVDDRLANGEPIFSRDCPEFYVKMPDQKTLVVLVNHFKSKGYGGKNSSDEKRRAQAERVKAIYKSLRQQGMDWIAVVGDLNDTPESWPLEPLLEETDLRDIFVHPLFNDGGFPGTFELCNAKNKIDYLLLSPALFDKVTAGGIFRAGMWPGTRPKRWETYETLTRPEEAASDHGAIWVDLDI